MSAPTSYLLRSPNGTRRVAWWFGEALEQHPWRDPATGSVPSEQAAAVDVSALMEERDRWEAKALGLSREMEEAIRSGEARAVVQLGLVDKRATKAEEERDALKVNFDRDLDFITRPLETEAAALRLNRDGAIEEAAALRAELEAATESNLRQFKAGKAVGAADLAALRAENERLEGCLGETDLQAGRAAAKLTTAQVARDTAEAARDRLREALEEQTKRARTLIGLLCQCAIPDLAVEGVRQLRYSNERARAALGGEPEKEESDNG